MARAPFKAIENLLDSGVSFHVAAMTDSIIVPDEEREFLIKKLEKIAANLEEEHVDPYDMTLFRLKQAGVRLKW